MSSSARLMKWMKSLACALALICAGTGHTVVHAAEEPTKPSKPNALEGQRIYSIGHSFHVFMPAILQQMAKSAGIPDHQQVGLSSIGGSYVHQHWDVADDKFKSKAVLESGNLDVLTIAPLFLPDDGIENFVKLASEKSPNIRVFVQEFWLPFDSNVNFRKEKAPTPDRELFDLKKLQEEHDEYFHEIDEHVKKLNEEYGGKPQVFVVPVGQAVLLLRQKIADGTAPGLTKQTDLFTDAIGHAKPPLAVLVAYCYYTQIYGNPIGLPVPPALRLPGDENIRPLLTLSGTPPAEPAVNPATAKLNKLLQEIALDAAAAHPLSGVKIIKR